MNEHTGGERWPVGAVGALIVFGLVGASLLAIGPKDYPDLHTILDTGIALLTGQLALLLWDIGGHTARPLPKWLAISFAASAILALMHVFVTVEWSGPLAPIAAARSFLRPATWPPQTHVLPIGIGYALWLKHRGRNGVLGYGLVVTALGAALFAAFQELPTYLPPGPLGITRPALILSPLMWAIIGVVCWRWRASDRLLRPLTWMAATLLVANTVMLYSRAPADPAAMVAHLGRIAGYATLLLFLMQFAAMDMRARIRAEGELSRSNQELERRVIERTVQIEAANGLLEGEIVVRRQAEQKAQAQLDRLYLLHNITRAIGERQDLNSIFQVVLRSLEDQLPVDFACLCLYDRTDRTLTVACVGVKSDTLALELAMPERATIEIDENGLSRCVQGQLVYEPDITELDFSFPRRLARGGLGSLVVAPLQVESRVFGVLTVARTQGHGFSSGECEFLRQLSEHTALAVHQAQLYGALQVAYDDLRQTQQAVMQQERLRALGQMASGIAHDINNALSPVALYTESLLETETGLSASARNYLETIQRAVEDVGHTVVRMKDFYRQREPQLTLRPVQLNQLVPQVKDLTRARWSDMPLQLGIVIDLQTDLAADLPPVMAVESEIREALINLIFNAVDAIPDGGTLTLRTRIADNALGTDSRIVEIEIEDNGVGMDEDTRQRCLEPFFTTKGERGTGLGLAMVYGVAQRHGAEINIKSSLGIGTTVRLSFPAQNVEPAATSRYDATPAARPTRMRLLVVDDDPILLKSLRDILETDGHVVTTASEGQAGIDAFRAACDGQAFDAVVTDLGMPYVDGRRVAEAVKAASPSTPVILLTGWGQRLISEDDIPPHVDQVLSKPPKLREVREALERCRQAATG